MVASWIEFMHCGNGLQCIGRASMLARQGRQWAVCDQITSSLYHIRLLLMVHTVTVIIIKLNPSNLSCFKEVAHVTTPVRRPVRLAWGSTTHMDVFNFVPYDQIMRPLHLPCIWEEYPTTCDQMGLHTTVLRAGLSETQ